MKLLTTSKNPVDRLFLGLVLILLAIGFFIFSSATLGLLARGSSFGTILLKQSVMGLAGGVGAYILSRVHYRHLRKIAFFAFIGSAMLTALILIPGLGFEHGGATRWLLVGGYSFQPAEFLKLGTVLYLAALFSSRYIKPSQFKQGLLPVILILSLVSGLLVTQPDTGTIAVIGVTAFCMYIVAGGRWLHAGILAAIATIAIVILVLNKSYIEERLIAFWNLDCTVAGSSYQVCQAKLAIGSGEIFGRGFGQSIQKFNLLPEQIGDSIFAVAAEEWGFVGSVTIVVLFALFTLRGLYLASHAPDTFARLLVVGIVILIASQSFVNIAAMLSLVPITGVPLLFISQGGTALIGALLGVGIILNISRYRT
ncbi:MAG: FtsW/RodA/SpoVE family cell cycle protein [bacterium]|nr:FtsW/RodA/SpoVE family cell cycle protein [bacterium]